MSTKEKVSFSKLSKIAEIQGLLDETKRGKEWLLDQLKKHKIKTKTIINTFEVLKECPDNFLSQMLRSLKGEDIVGFEDIKTLTKTYHWFFTDIVAGSNPTIPTKNQVKKIIVLNELIQRTTTFSKRDLNSTVVLATGDGYAIGFSDSPEKPIHLAMELHKVLYRYNESQRGNEKLLLRIGIDMGPVYVIKDLNNMDNVWGPGIILTRRVMDLAGDMNIFASARIADDLLKLSSDYKKILHPIGSYHIKHGEELQLFNIYGEGFGNKIAPRLKKVKTVTLDQSMRSVYNFKFETIEIALDVIDIKTMLTHHTWSWTVRNVSKETKDQIFYTLDGDSPKDFAKMNVQISDDKGKQLEIQSLNVNKPYHKEFVVKLPPIQPKKTKSIKLQYDWEEPDRNFLNRVPSDCKQLTYLFSIPKRSDIKIRVLKVDMDTGLKILADPAPLVKHLADKTIVSWSKQNLKAYDAYQFFW
ncbi:MAG TPA: hypothetical protein VD731_06050 [Nitrosopumilaceae archaeon]|nr:hypothetical protein [Nitrosopumilaceae archaeon]